MIRLIAVCVIFAVSCYAVPVSVNSVSRADKIPYQREIYKTAFPAAERNKRALASLIVKFLRKARLDISYGNYKQFTRSGGYNQALKDFEGLKPTHTRTVRDTLRGHVGDTEVIVSKNGETVMTLVTEKRVPGGTITVEVDTVIYYD